MIYYILLISVQILFGINFVASKVVLSKWSPVTFACSRFLVSGLFLLIIAKMMRQKVSINKSQFKDLFILAAIGLCVNQFLFLKGLSLTTATNTSLLASTIPLFVVLVNRIKGLEKFNSRKKIGLVLSFAGVLILRKVEEFSLSDKTLWGDLLILGASFSYAWIISFSSQVFKKVKPMVGSAHMFWMGGLLFLFVIPFLPGEVSFEQSDSFYMCLAYSILGATCLTYLFNNIVLTKIESNVVGFFIFLQPVVAAIFSYLVYDTVITVRSLISFIIIAIGVILVTKKDKVKTSS